MYFGSKDKKSKLRAKAKVPIDMQNTLSPTQCNWINPPKGETGGMLLKLQKKFCIFYRKSFRHSCVSTEKKILSSDQISLTQWFLLLPVLFFWIQQSSTQSEIQSGTWKQSGKVSSQNGRTRRLNNLNKNIPTPDHLEPIPNSEFLVKNNDDIHHESTVHKWETRVSKEPQEQNLAFTCYFCGNYRYLDILCLVRHAIYTYTCSRCVAIPFLHYSYT